MLGERYCLLIVVKRKSCHLLARCQHVASGNLLCIDGQLNIDVACKLEISTDASDAENYAVYRILHASGDIYAFIDEVSNEPTRLFDLVRQSEIPTLRKLRKFAA